MKKSLTTREQIHVTLLIFCYNESLTGCNEFLIYVMKNFQCPLKFVDMRVHCANVIMFDF